MRRNDLGSVSPSQGRAGCSKSGCRDMGGEPEGVGPIQLTVESLKWKYTLKFSWGRIFFAENATLAGSCQFFAHGSHPSRRTPQGNLQEMRGPFAAAGTREQTKSLRRSRGNRCCFCRQANKKTDGGELRPGRISSSETTNPRARARGSSSCVQKRTGSHERPTRAA